MLLVPFSYSQLFPGKETPAIDELLQHIPSRIVLVVLSYINHHLYLRTSEDKIFDFLARNWSDKVKNGILAAATVAARKAGHQPTFFSPWLVMEFIKQELLNWREFEYQHPDTTPDDELKIFIAYLVSVDRTIFENQDKLTGSKANPITHFFEFTWPSLVQQYEFTTELNPIFQALKTNAFLEEMLKLPEFSTSVREYLADYGFDTPWTFVSGYIDIIKAAIHKENRVELPLLNIPIDHPYRQIIERRVIDPEEYAANKRDQIRYAGIRKQPLFHFEDNAFLVSNWNFLYSQLGIGVTFDLFYRSKTLRKAYGDIPTFRSFIGKHVSEEIIFQSLLKFAYSKNKYDVLHLGEKDEYPDGYLRQGNSIFIFEYKDVLFADAITEAATFADITATVREKFLKNAEGKPKGVQQIANHIEYLSKAEFGFDHFTQKHRRQSVDIYPVIVYSHDQFSMPGVNHWLNEQAASLLQGFPFRSVKPVTLISESYLFNFLKMFREHRLKDILNDYYKTLQSINRKFERTGKFTYLVNRYGSIEDIRSSFEKGNSFKDLKRSETMEILDAFKVPYL
ncbi:hypothetical protein [Neolewinella lacunae]|nr:hypothetical protein [Neolewinella lacunae]